VKSFILLGIIIYEGTYVKTLLHANDHIILQESKNALQISFHKQQWNIKKKYLPGRPRQWHSMENTPPALKY
jgi:hypothetical protein